MENPPYVPYQAYKVCLGPSFHNGRSCSYTLQSKRHNRVHSNPQVVANVAPPPLQPRSAATTTNGHAYSESAVTQAADGVADVEKRSMVILNGRASLQRPVSMIDTLTHLQQEPTQASEANSEKSPVERPLEKPLPLPEAPSPVLLVAAPASPIQQAPPSQVSPSPVHTPPPSAVPLPSSPLSPASSPKMNGKAVARTTSPVAGPSTLSPALSDRSLASSRKSSTFRHVPLRPPASRPTMPSSPFRPASMHVQSPSRLAASPRPAERHLHELSRGLSSAVSTPTMPQDRALPPVPALELQSHQSPSLPVAQASSPTRIAPISSPIGMAPHARASTLGTPPIHDGLPSHSVTSSPSHGLTPSTLTSSAAMPSASRAPGRSSAPYRPGFQPKGVYRPRTDEFVEARNQNRDAGRVERTRLERRLEKLINLHFPPPGQRKQEASEPRPMQQNRRASSFWDLDLKNKSAGDLWREVVQSQGSQIGKNDIRGWFLSVFELPCIFVTQVCSC